MKLRHLFGVGGALLLIGLAACGDDDVDTNGVCSGQPTECASLHITSCAGQHGCSVGEVCSGSPDICHGFAESQSCMGQRGCDWGEYCQGAAEMCSRMTLGACSYQEGCFWWYAYQKCAGIPSSCYVIPNGDCDRQLGCSLGDLCSGIADRCDSFSGESCSSQTGCFVGTSCLGVASTCSALDGRAECESQSGCHWTPS